MIPMQTIRAVVRLIAIFVLSLLVLFVFCPGLLIFGASKKSRTHWKNKWIRFWSKGVAGIIGLKMHIEGPPPAPPFLLVSNHLSYIDILPFWANLDTTFVAKSEVSHWPAIGWAARLMEVIFINRANKRDLIRVNNHIEANIHSEQGVTIFPEGTSSKGETVLPFLSSLLLYGARHEMPVCYAAISYSGVNDDEFTAWEDVCWWGDMDFLPHLWTLLKIECFSVRLRFGAIPVVHDDRKMLTSSLHSKVCTIFEPTYIEK